MEMKEVKQYNKDLGDLSTDITISRRCENMLIITINLGNNALKIWKYLKEDFESGLSVELNVYDIAVDIRRLKMPNTLHFSNWATEFREKPNFARRQIMLPKFNLAVEHFL